MVNDTSQVQWPKTKAGVAILIICTVAGLALIAFLLAACGAFSQIGHEINSPTWPNWHLPDLWGG
ncbi:MAG: hypothetical protein NTY30_01735 [Candidatus Berkelbacteria bacterium]|nr:hypothetical protein [Candidatus Berkelbacteria bacterium]